MTTNAICVSSPYLKHVFRPASGHRLHSMVYILKVVNPNTRLERFIHTLSLNSAIRYKLPIIVVFLMVGKITSYFSRHILVLVGRS